MFEPTAIYAPNPHRYDTMTYNRAGTSSCRPSHLASGTTSATSRHSTR